MNFHMFSSKNKSSETSIYGDEWEIKPTNKLSDYKPCLGALISPVHNKAKIKLLPYNLSTIHDPLGAKNNLYKADTAAIIMDPYLDSITYVKMLEEERRYQEAKIKKEI